MEIQSIHIDNILFVKRKDSFRSFLLDAGGTLFPTRKQSTDPYEGNGRDGQRWEGLELVGGMKHPISPTGGNKRKIDDQELEDR